MMEELGFPWTVVIPAVSAVLASYWRWRGGIEERRAAEILMRLERERRRGETELPSWVWIAVGFGAMYLLRGE